MNEDIIRLISTVLVEELSCDSATVTDDAVLGPAGLGLESLDLLHLIYTLSDEFHVVMVDDLDPYWSMTVGDLAGDVAARMATK